MEAFYKKVFRSRLKDIFLLSYERNSVLNSLGFLTRVLLFLLQFSTFLSQRIPTVLESLSCCVKLVSEQWLDVEEKGVVEEIRDGKEIWLR